jgi:dihydrofolate reductase
MNKILSCELTLIAACGLRGELGLNNQLPWHQERDLRFFADITKNAVLIMGRNTFESLGKKLPGRTHCILSKQMVSDDPELIILSDLKKLYEWVSKNNIKKAFVIGGAQLYHQLAPYCSSILITHINGIVKADTFLNFNMLWNCELTQAHFAPADQKNQFSMTFANYSNLYVKDLKDIV